MARNFKELRANMDPDRRVRVECRVEEALKELTQAQLVVFPESDVLIDQFEDLEPRTRNKATATA